MKFSKKEDDYIVKNIETPVWILAKKMKRSKSGILLRIKELNLKPLYRYKVKEDGRLFEYTGIFRSIEAAEKWHNNYGLFIKNSLNRELVLVW